MRFIKSRKAVLIQENYKKAKEYLDIQLKDIESERDSDNGLDIDNIQKELKELLDVLSNDLKKNPNYIETFFKYMFQNHGIAGAIDYLELRKNGFVDEYTGYDNPFSMIKWMKNNKASMKNLPKSILEYDEFEKLVDDVRKLELKTQSNEFYKLLKYIGYTEDDIEKNKVKIDSVAQRYYNLDKKVKSELTGKNGSIAHYKYNKVPLNTFLNDVELMINRLGDKSDVISELKKYKGQGKDVDIIYDKGDVLMFRTIDQDIIKQFGSQKWCIVYSDNYYKRYCTKPENTQYIIMDFSKDASDKNSLYGITLDDNGNPLVGAQQNKNNNEVKLEDISKNTGIPLELLTKIDNVYTREIQPVIDKYTPITNIDDLKTFTDEIESLDYDVNKKVLLSNAFKTMDYDLSMSQLIDLADNGYETFLDEVKIKDYSKDDWLEYLDKHTSFNKLNDDIIAKFNTKAIKALGLETYMDNSLLEDPRYSMFDVYPENRTRQKTIDLDATYSYDDFKEIIKNIKNPSLFNYAKGIVPIVFENMDEESKVKYVADVIGTQQTSHPGAIKNSIWEYFIRDLNRIYDVSRYGTQYYKDMEIPFIVNSFKDYLTDLDYVDDVIDYMDDIMENVVLTKKYSEIKPGNTKFDLAKAIANLTAKSFEFEYLRTINKHLQGDKKIEYLVDYVNKTDNKYNEWLNEYPRGESFFKVAFGDKAPSYDLFVKFFDGISDINVKQDLVNEFIEEYLVTYNSWGTSYDENGLSASEYRKYIEYFIDEEYDMEDVKDVILYYIDNYKGNGEYSIEQDDDFIEKILSSNEVSYDDIYNKITENDKDDSENLSYFNQLQKKITGSYSDNDYVNLASIKEGDPYRLDWSKDENGQYLYSFDGGIEDLEDFFEDGVIEHNPDRWYSDYSYSHDMIDLINYKNLMYIANYLNSEYPELDIDMDKVNAYFNDKTEDSEFGNEISSLLSNMIEYPDEYPDNIDNDEIKEEIVRVYNNAMDDALENEYQDNAVDALPNFMDVDFKNGVIRIDLGDLLDKFDYFETILEYNDNPTSIEDILEVYFSEEGKIGNSDISEPHVWDGEENFKEIFNDYLVNYSEITLPIKEVSESNIIKFKDIK